MKEVMICRSTDLINGGCNACPTVKSTVYSLEMNGLNRPLANFDVASMVMTIAIAEGYEQHQEFDMTGDRDVFKKNGNEVELEEDFSNVTYKKGTTQRTAKKAGLEEAELFAKVNEILVACFDLEPITFVWDDI